MLSIVALSVVASLIALLLYLLFGDLSRHKGRIESWVTQEIGRPFAIDGPFALDLFPAVKVQAEKVRIANAAWSTTPQMVQVGRFATEIGLWSLVSGPAHVRSLELRDVTVVLERNREGQDNWTFGTPGTEDPARDDDGLRKLPIAFERAEISNLAVIYRSPGTPDRITRIGNLNLRPDAQGMLELQGNGTVDGYKADLSGRLGPIEALLSGRNIQLDLAGGIGNLRLAAKGGIGRLHPLDGADVRASVKNPDLGTLLENLRLPVIATGPLDIRFSLKDAGDRTALDLTAKTGDLSLRTTGQVGALGLRDSDLRVEAKAMNAARLASVFDIRDVPADELTLEGRMISTTAGFRFNGIRAALGEYEARLDGRVPGRRGGAAQLRFDLAVPSVAMLMSSLPSLPMKIGGELAYRTKANRRPGSRQLLRSARNVRMDLSGDLGNTRFAVKGGLERLDPLEGTNLALSLENPEVSSLLEKLEMPVFASGPLHVNAFLKKTGKLRNLDLTATTGDLSLHTTGNLTTLDMRNSDLTFEVRAPDAERLASVFDIKGVPPGELNVVGHLTTTLTDYHLDGVQLTLGEYAAHLDGTIPMGDSASQLRFDLAIPSLQILKANLPPLPLKVSGDMARHPAKLELANLVARFGESQVRGEVTLSGDDYRQIEADLNAPLLDLTPFLPEASAPTGEKKTFLFGEKPIRFPKLGNSRTDLHVAAEEIRFSRGVLHGVDSTLRILDGQLQSTVRARGGFGGRIEGSIDFTPADDESAALKLDLNLLGVRSGFASGDAVRPEEVPPIDLEVSLTSSGATPRQLAAAASGSVLLSHGPGKAKRGALDRMGGDILAQLFSRLNPFSKDDPYTQVDCLVARIDITDGKARVAPLLMQSRKVAITANGTIDLKTEKLLMRFTTRPRQGIGISPGMFTNPFLDLTGTLTNPSIGVGTKGVTSGAVAAATGGLSVLAQGVVDRAIGETDQCREVLAKAQQPLKAP